MTPLQETKDEWVQTGLNSLKILEDAVQSKS